jgi:hypothetical protein
VEFRKTRRSRNVKFDKVLEMCFQELFMIFGSLEPVKLQIHEYVKFAGRDSKKTWSRERAEVWTRSVPVVGG